MLTLAQLDFDLTEEEDEAFLKKESSTLLKLMKVLLFNMGILEKRVGYQMGAFKSEVKDIVKDNDDVSKFKISQISDNIGTANFEMNEFKLRMNKLYTGSIQNQQ